MQFNNKVGVQSSLKILTLDKKVVAFYSHEKFQVFITLVCSNVEGFGVFHAQVRNGSMQQIYDATLISRYACFKSSFKPLDDGASHLSTGDVLLIFLFCSFAGYLLIGSAHQIFVKKRSGWAIIPNHVFWLALPGWILDGVRFAFCGFWTRPRSNYGDI